MAISVVTLDLDTNGVKCGAGTCRPGLGTGGRFLSSDGSLGVFDVLTVDHFQVCFDLVQHFA